MTPGEQTRDFYRKQGAEAERERIIKLLEEHMPNSSDHDFVGCECEYPTNNWYNNHLVALIKGESQKDNETVSPLTEGENK